MEDAGGVYSFVEAAGGRGPGRLGLPLVRGADPGPEPVGPAPSLRRLGIPVPAGETVRVHEMAEGMRRAVDVLRGDVQMKGGITGLRKACAIAELFGYDLEVHRHRAGAARTREPARGVVGGGIRVRGGPRSVLLARGRGRPAGHRHSGLSGPAAGTRPGRGDRLGLDRGRDPGGHPDARLTRQIVAKSPCSWRVEAASRAVSSRSPLSHWAASTSLRWCSSCWRRRHRSGSTSRSASLCR